MTFKSPFGLASNGFFSLWLGSFFSFFLCCRVHSGFGSFFKGKALHLFFLFVFSLVNLLQLVFVMEKIYVIPVICASIGLGFSIFLFILLQVASSALDKILGICAIILMLNWGFGAGWETFENPFLFASNGYFSGWLALGVSVFLAADAYGVSTDTGYTIVA